MESTESADVVIVGSGAGGAPIAMELARAGASVVILEKGPHVPPDRMVHDEVAVRRHFMVPDPREEPHTIRYGSAAHATMTAEGWTANIVGGATVHYSGFFHRMQPVDMRLRSTLGKVERANIIDWPITYDDLEPFYTRLDHEVGVAGRWMAHPFEEPRSKPYPLPPIEEHPIAKRIDDAAEKLGLHPFPTPRAILPVPYDGRGACAYCPMCAQYGCPTGAKGSSLSVFLPAAVATGRCEVRAECMATEVPLRADGKVDGVVYRARRDESSHFIRARVVIVACSAVETARLLLMSRSSRFPTGLTNANGWVGKGLWFSTSALGGATFARSNGGTGLKHLSAQRSIQDFYHMDPPIGGVAKAGTLSFLFGYVEPIARAERVAFLPTADKKILFGERLKRRIQEQASREFLEFESFCETLPNDGTYVDLDPDTKDRWGMPVARITTAAHTKDRDGAKLIAQKAMDLLGAMGPEEAHVTEPHSQTKFLQGGTCRFGSDPAESVLDRNCRAHEVPNLYVTDGSFLPTSSGVPPTMTIMANSLRVARTVVGRLRDRTL